LGLGLGLKFNLLLLSYPRHENYLHISHISHITHRLKRQLDRNKQRVTVNKIFIEQNTIEPKVKAYIPMYQPLETVKCKKCRKTIAEPKELIRIHKR
jgi:hypothetical protein